MATAVVETPSPSIAIDVAIGSGFQQAAYSVVPTATPTIRIRLSDLVPTAVTVTVDDARSDGPVNVSSEFEAGLLASGHRAQATLTVSPGQTRISVSVAGSHGTVKASAVMLNVPPGLLTVASATHFKPVIDKTARMDYEGGTVLLMFSMKSGLPPINALLRAEHLEPLDYIGEIDMVRARITSGLSPPAEVKRIGKRTGLLAAGPNMETQTLDVSGEDMPERLRDGYRGTAGAACAAGATLYGCITPGLATDFRQHFLMDTFAALRLVDVIHGRAGAAWPGANAGIAIVDIGLGNGVVPAAGATTAADVPPAAIFNITDLAAAGAPQTFNANGVQVLPAGAPPNTLATIPDRIGARAHGTPVTAAAASRGDSVGGNPHILGTGRDAQVRPIRIPSGVPGGLALLIIGVVNAGIDPGVDVINLSQGIPAVRYPVNPATGLPIPGGAAIPIVVPAGTIAQLRAMAVQSSLGFADVGRDGNPLTVDADGSQGNGVWDGPLVPGGPSEPYADRNGNGTWDVDDGTILVNAGGEDVLPYPPRTGQGADRMGNGWPESLAPTVPRGPGSLNFMAVSASGTADNFTEPEHLAAFSDYGAHISVAALGEHVDLPDNTGVLRIKDGTSFSAPQVAGIAAEIDYLEKNTHAAGARFTPRQVIELIEATADDLGSLANRATVGIPRPNDNPGNGRDVYFGNGRANAWKAMLAEVNRGVSDVKLTNLVGPPLPPVMVPAFPDLAVIDDAHTQWYGFKVLTSVLGATAWIDGHQLQESAAIEPGPSAAAPAAGAHATLTPDITAYAGVRSNNVTRIGVPNEDPMKGIVPVGNGGGVAGGSGGGTYVMTFSIERSCHAAADVACLVNPDGSLRTLSLRLPGQTAVDAPFYNLRLDLPSMRAGHVAGVVFDDFVFTLTPPDYNDRPGPAASAINSSLEWLGRPDWRNFQAVSPEESPTDPSDPDGRVNLTDNDRHDDGVVFYPTTIKPGNRAIGRFTACVSDPNSGRYNATPPRSLYVNGWIDWNGNGTFEPAERIVNMALDPRTWAGGLASATGRCGTYDFNFLVPAAITKGDLWARFRLDYGENAGAGVAGQLFPSEAGLAGPVGATRYGEVEDYRIGSDFGDAPDVGHGDYPTLKVNAGARQLDDTSEWIGATVTREPDACLTHAQAVADQDPKPNLGFEEDGCNLSDGDGGDDSVVGVSSTDLSVVFTAHSTISTTGYDEGGPDAPTPVVVTSLDSDCTVKPFQLLSTPTASAGKGRYTAVPVDDDRDGRLDEDPIDGVDNDHDGRVDEDPPGIRPLIANIWVDWNNDGSWSQPGDWVLQNAVIAPETFGADGKYTLGEPFVDLNHDGVRESNEPFTDVAGKDTKAFTCRFPRPPGADGQIGWTRIRLSYAELADGTIPASGGVPSERLVDAGVAHATEAARADAGPMGGALFGEVEDYPGFGPPPNLTIPVLVMDGGTFAQLEGAKLELFNGPGCTGTPIATGTSAANGLFDFGGLGPSVYSVRETPPASFDPTQQCLPVDLGNLPKQPTTVLNRNAEAVGDPFPPAGTDSFSSFARVHVHINGVGDFAVTLNGPTTIQRGPVQLGQNELRVIQTGMTQLELAGPIEVKGESIGTLSVNVSPTKPSLGLITQNAPGSDFPALSSFDLYLQFTTPLGVLHNDDPIHMHATITDIPPIFTVYNPENEPIPLKSNDGTVVGEIDHAAHVPVPKNEFGIVFENTGQ
jgi:hypothetical protein